MDIERARELLATHVAMGSGYNRNAARLVLAEVQRTHGQQAVDRLIVELDLERHFGFKPGQEFLTP